MFTGLYGRMQVVACEAHKDRLAERQRFPSGKVCFFCKQTEVGLTGRPLVAVTLKALEEKA